MDRTSRVDGVYRKLVIAEKVAAIRREPPPLPNRGPYRVLVADPPWRFDWRAADPTRSGVCPYPQMGIDEICALPVAGIAHDDALLWLWATNAHLPEAFKVLDAWGFQYRTTLTWVKNRIGTGDWLRG
jgi:N6-adenosine-specific RNA methylase IME4